MVGRPSPDALASLKADLSSRVALRSPAQPCPHRPCEAVGRMLRTLPTAACMRPRRQIFFDYLARAYQLFLAGEDDTSALEEQAG